MRWAGFLLPLLLTGAIQARAGVPSAAEVLRGTAKWSADLPGEAVKYRVLVSRVHAGQAVLGTDRVLSGDRDELKRPAFELMTALLRRPTLEALRGRGIDVATTSLYHLHRRVVVIVGAEPTKPGTAQVWFDRATGRPLRIILPQENGDPDTLTLRGPFPPHLDWTGASGGLAAVPGCPRPK